MDATIVSVALAAAAVAYGLLRHARTETVRRKEAALFARRLRR